MQLHQSYLNNLVDDISEERVMSFRTLFMKPIDGLTELELSHLKDQQGLWPSEDKSWEVPLPQECRGAFVIRNLRQFMLCHHPFFDQSPSHPLYWNSRSFCAPHNQPHRFSPERWVRLAPPPPPARAATSHQGNGKGGGREMRQAKRARTPMDHETPVAANSSQDSKRQRPASQPIAELQGRVPKWVATPKDPSHPHGSVLSLAYRNFNRLAELKMTIPMRPNIHTPIVCLNSWAYESLGDQQDGEEEAWRGDCTVPNCPKLHAEDLHPGMVSYESIRFQAAFFWNNKPNAVKTLLELVETQKNRFPPEDKE
eukprot:gene32728-40395_t